MALCLFSLEFLVSLLGTIVYFGRETFAGAKHFNAAKDLTTWSILKYKQRTWEKGKASRLSENIRHHLLCSRPENQEARMARLGMSGIFSDETYDRVQDLT
ncbi:uncharacterized protein HD556DRAFT_1306206 [Suillus plorans]|uniref:Uncharacterized protein n=1 Tax=Suillus plorans TaxID=116603 RepID=A0A9P7DM26_9AGAM|nr:uncharacterized protein HD556DRAFT_1306206 [Suillus plorans]KAG1798168.1 hypothetical protein HD556DRAFT_1306206 [Suillus plorans]